MKVFLAILVCLLFGLSVFAQTEDPKDPNAVEVEKITLAREDAEGNIEEDINIFKPTDTPIYCYIDLNSKTTVTVKMNLVAVKAKGWRTNEKVVVVSYKTKDGENSVQFHASPEGFWTVGDYRVDIFLDGKLADSKEFKVEQSEKK
jgi:hypothetical protein